MATEKEGSKVKAGTAKIHPYKHLADCHFWKQSISDVAPSQLLQNWQAKFSLSESDKIITAGSCFAQHIGAWLKRNHFTFFDAEPVPYFVSEKVATEFGYGIYSARYGNQYTPRQLLQTIDRAFGQFEPLDDYWLNAKGAYLDPFRPQIEVNGFESIEHLYQDRAHHFHSVREAFNNADVLVFTLGLTECWQSTRDAAVFPICPGVISTDKNTKDYTFKNLGIDQTREDLTLLIRRLAEINPSLKVVLTVSPVPLVATFDGEHVLSASSYSKSVLRVACEEASLQCPHILYFPSYEIITGPQAPDFFAADRRSVTQQGVEQVMSIFASVLAKRNDLSLQNQNSTNNVESQRLENMEQVISQLCDEEALVKKS